MSRLIYDMTSADYHGDGGTFSSSQLKTMLEDPEVFYQKYITKEIAKESSSAFDVGTYFHTAILEPEKLAEECAVFEGIRRGKAWDYFQEENKGKAIITKGEFEVASRIIEAVKNSPVAMELLSQTKPEVSVFNTLMICDNRVYSPMGFELKQSGWEKVDKVPSDGTSITIKCRADAFNENFILDLKSTQGNTKNDFLMRKSISNYSYDLSAALYLDMFSLALGKPIHYFYWTFASKDIGNSRTYLASEKNIMVGRAKYKKALVLLGQCIEKDWKFNDSLGILEPNQFELEWLIEKSEDIL